MKQPAGLSKLEISISIAVIIVLILGLIIAVNPRGRAAKQRNDQRWADTQQLIDMFLTVHKDQGDKRGKKLSQIDENSSTVQLIVNGDVEGVQCSQPCAEFVTSKENCTVDIKPLKGQYIPEIPRDPSLKEGNVTGYYVNYTEGIFTVGACNPERDIKGPAPAVSITE